MFFWVGFKQNQINYELNFDVEIHYMNGWTCKKEKELGKDKFQTMIVTVGMCVSCSVEYHWQVYACSYCTSYPPLLHC